MRYFLKTFRNHFTIQYEIIFRFVTCWWQCRILIRQLPDRLLWPCCTGCYGPARPVAMGLPDRLLWAWPCNHDRVFESPFISGNSQRRYTNIVLFLYQLFTLQVTDKRVSRSHAILEVIDGKLYLTPVSIPLSIRKSVCMCRTNMTYK